ncbi:MAG: recombinase family protein [Chloroflexota bacterium]
MKAIASSGGLFTMLGATGQFENEIQAERQMDGILKAKARGVHFGPQRKLSDEQLIELKQRRENGELVKDLMSDYGISKATLYRYLTEE